MLHQIRYSTRKLVTPADLDRMRAKWAAGRPNRAVGPLKWLRKGKTTRAAVKAGYRGAAGFVKCYARPDRTLCDYDGRPPSLVWIFRIARLLETRPLVIRYDRTRRGWHVVVEWERRFSPVEIVAIQAVLGSDVQREAYNLARVMSGKARNRRWNILFHGKL